jgi:hypothetical protein
MCDLPKEVLEKVDDFIRGYNAKSNSGIKIEEVWYAGKDTYEGTNHNIFFITDGGYCEDLEDKISDWSLDIMRKNNFNLTMTNWSCGVGDVLNYAFEEKLYDYRMVGQTNLTPNH